MTTTPNIPTLSKRFADFAEIPWHEVEKKRRNEYPPKDCIYYCDLCQTHFPEKEIPLHANPDFRNPVNVLKVMKSKSDWYEFKKYLDANDWPLELSEVCANHVEVKYVIDETGQLLVEAVCFMEGKKEKR